MKSYSFIIWDKINKQFLPVSSINFLKNTVGVYDHNLPTHQLFGEIEYAREIVVLIPWTGFYDKKGYKIYVGDILETPRKKNPEHNKEFEGDLLVVKDSYSSGYRLHYICPLDWCDEIYNIDNIAYACRYRVVGNIFENPELMGEEE